MSSNRQSARDSYDTRTSEGHTYKLNTDLGVLSYPEAYHGNL